VRGFNLPGGFVIDTLNRVKQRPTPRSGSPQQSCRAIIRPTRPLSERNKAAGDSKVPVESYKALLPEKGHVVLVGRHTMLREGKGAQRNELSNWRGAVLLRPEGE